MGVRSPLLRALLTAAYRVAYRSEIGLFGIDLPYNVPLGPRLRFVHHGCIVMGAGRSVTTLSFTAPPQSAWRGPTGARRRSSATAGDWTARVAGGGIPHWRRRFRRTEHGLDGDLPAGATALGNPCRQVDLAKLTTPAKAPSARKPASVDSGKN